MKIVDYMPPMLTGDALDQALSVLPSYTTKIVERSQAERLLALNSIYDIFIPTQMTREIYTRLYMALHRSLQRKESTECVKQANENYKARIGIRSSSVIGGSDCMTIIGMPGIGKSRNISEVIQNISGNNLIQVDNPFRKVVPCITVQTPFDSSVKSLLLEILKETDRHLNTSFYDGAVRSKATVDVLIGSVSTIALQHIGMIIVDEIQNITRAKQGRNLVGCLTQLINNAGVAIVMVGTPDCIDFFESEMFLSRRAVGLRYDALPFDDTFVGICRHLFEYQYVRKAPFLTDDLCYWLWSKTQGNVSALLGMFVGAQEIAILDGTEEVSRKTLQEAYETRLAALHLFLQPKKKHLSKPRNEAPTYVKKQIEDQASILPTYAIIVKKAKQEGTDPLQALHDLGLVESVAL